MLNLEITNSFKKDLKTCRRRNLDIQKLDYVFQKLLQEEDVSLFKDHALIGNWINHRELHIQSDWLLIYIKTSESIIAVRTGSHRSEERRVGKEC